MDSEFIKVFEPFNIILTTLNYKIKTNSKLNHNDLENIALLKIIISQFFRIKNDVEIDLKTIINE